MLGNRGTRKGALLDEVLDTLADSDMAVIPALVSVTMDGKARLDVFPDYYHYRGREIVADEAIKQILRCLEKAISKNLKIAVILGDADGWQQLTLRELLAERNG